MCRTYNGWDINWAPAWKEALEKVAKDGKLDRTVLRSGRQKDGRGNISPVTIILPTLAAEVKLAQLQKLSKDAVLQEADVVFKKQNGRHLTKEEISELEKHLNDRNSHCSFNQANILNEVVDKLADKDLRVDAFMKLLDRKIDEAIQMLVERFDYQCSQSSKSAKFMYENNTMYGYVPEEGIRSALKHGTIVVGQLGLAETLVLLIGKDHTTDEGMELAKKIESFFNKKIKNAKETMKMNIGVYLTPAENLAYTALKKFQDLYGKIDNVSDREFFTNSMHVPVWDKVDPFEKIDIESQLTGYSNAGCITYTEMDADAQKNTEALEKLVLYAMDKDLPYFAVNVPADSCQVCGYQGLIDGNCPQCGSDKIERLRRVTGYLTGDYKTAFNKGKQDEVEHRVKHNGIDIDKK